MGTARKKLHSDPVEIGARIRKCREAMSLTQDALAQKIGGVSRAAVALWEATGEIKLQNLAMVASVLRADMSYLVSGKGSTRHNGSVPPNAKGVIMEMKGGIGAAGPAHLTSAVSEWWRVNPSALEAMGVHVDNVKIFRVDTRLMQPTINPGTYVLVDFSQRDLCDGQVYAIDSGISLTLKRVYLSGRNNVEVVSDSEAQRRTRLPMKTFKVAGRLVAQLLAPL